HNVERFWRTGGEPVVGAYAGAEDRAGRAVGQLSGGTGDLLEVGGGCDGGAGDARARLLGSGRLFVVAFTEGVFLWHIEKRDSGIGQEVDGAAERDERTAGLHPIL